MTLAVSDVRQESWMLPGPDPEHPGNHPEGNGAQSGKRPLLRDQRVDGLFELFQSNTEESAERGCGNRSGDPSNRMSQVPGASELRPAGHGNGSEDPGHK